MHNLFEKVDEISSLKSIPSTKIFGGDIISDNYPFFTIAIPTFKRSTFLIEALNSALNQEGFDNYNIIVCDNNPEFNDETDIVMRQYKDAPKITYYKHSQNLGMAGNWNKCMLLSDSERVVFLHDDDILSPYALKIFYNILCNISSDWTSIKSDVLKFSNSNSISFIQPITCSLHTVSNYDFWKACPIGAPTGILLNKKAVIDIGGFHSRFFPCIDYEMAFNLSSIGKSYIIDNRVVLCGYRVAKNESLSEITMDKYFIKRMQISSQIMKSMSIPSCIIKYLQSYYTFHMLEHEKKYYNMPEYELKPIFKNYLKRHGLVSKSVIEFLLRIVNKINKLYHKQIVITFN